MLMKWKVLSLSTIATSRILPGTHTIALNEALAEKAALRAVTKTPPVPNKDSA